MRRPLLALLAALALAGCSEGPAEEPAPPAPPETAAGPAAETEAPPETEPPAEAAGGGGAVVALVVDGDTIELRDGREVRLVQIDSPEGNEGECYADEARAELRALLPEGTRVRLEADARLDRVDQYGRLLRYVFAGGRNVNLELVRRGAATVWFYGGDRGRYATRFLEAARQAKAKGRGLWGACPGTPFDPLHGADTGTGPAPPEAESGCPGAISWREARGHAGEETTVEGPVAGAFYAADSNGQPTFLNLGVDYPDLDRFTVLIWGDDRGKFPDPPEVVYAGKTICVSGEIELYQGVPEIEVSSPSQIAVAG